MCEFLKDAPRMYVASVCVVSGWGSMPVGLSCGCKYSYRPECLLTSFLSNTYPLLSKHSVMWP